VPVEGAVARKAVVGAVEKCVRAAAWLLRASLGCGLRLPSPAEVLAQLLRCVLCFGVCCPVLRVSLSRGPPAARKSSACRSRSAARCPLHSGTGENGQGRIAEEVVSSPAISSDELVERANGRALRGLAG